MAHAVQRTAARRDFIIHYAYLAERGGLDLANRFREAVETTYAELAEMPGMGAPGKLNKESMLKCESGESGTSNSTL